MRCWGKEERLYLEGWKPQKTRILENCLTRVLDSRFFYRKERGGRAGGEAKRPIIFANISWLDQTLGGDVFPFFFPAAIHRWAGSECFSVSWTKVYQFSIQAEGAGSLRWAIVFASNCRHCLLVINLLKKKKKKERKRKKHQRAKVKLKETYLIWS